MIIDAKECDRCSAQALGKYPKGWGILSLARDTPYLSTGERDLCGTCLEAVYEFFYTRPLTPSDK